jgi:hypothetical protein
VASSVLAQNLRKNRGEEFGLKTKVEEKEVLG